MAATTQANYRDNLNNHILPMLGDKKIEAAAVLVSLGVTAAWHGGWWLDPVVGLVIAGWSIREGVEAWRGENCC